jgi:hypothetical protein
MNMVLWHDGVVDLIGMEKEGYWAMVRKHGETPYVCKVEEITVCREVGGNYFFVRPFDISHDFEYWRCVKAGILD